MRRCAHCNEEIASTMGSFKVGKNIIVCSTRCVRRMLKKLKGN